MAENFLQQTVDWFSGAIASVGELVKRVGWPLTVLIVLAAAGGFLWWKWEHVEKLPGVKWLFERLKRRKIVRARADVLTIAVARLARDKDREHENVLLDELGQFEGVAHVSVDHTVDPEQPDKKKAEEKARGLLGKTGADVLIWGSVISRGSESAMRLYWTPARDALGAKSNGKYLPTETLALPEEFWGDLKEILGLLTQSRLADISFGQPGHYIAGKLAPLISQVRALIEKKEGVWKPEILAGVRFGLATALSQYGEQSGKNEPLAESIALYRKVLDETTRARVPLDWATTQMNLGNALMSLGERESGTARLEEAVAAYRAALQENTRARVPLEWAMTQTNLGNALGALGERESGTARLEEAVAAFRDALQENTRARVPLQWAGLQMNLGTALTKLGARERGAARLEEAVAAYRQALQEWTRERVPLDWARCTGNQGVALMLLAERHGDTEIAKLAVQQIEQAFTASRDGGDAPSAATFEAQLPKAHALAQKLAKR